MRNPNCFSYPLAWLLAVGNLSPCFFAQAESCNLCPFRGDVPSFPDRLILLGEEGYEDLLVETCGQLEIALSAVSETSKECQEAQAFGTYCGCPIPRDACRLCPEGQRVAEEVANLQVEGYSMMDYFPVLIAKDNLLLTCELLESLLHTWSIDTDTSKKEQNCATVVEDVASLCTCASVSAQEVDTAGNNSAFFNPIPIIQSDINDTVKEDDNDDAQLIDNDISPVQQLLEWEIGSVFIPDSLHERALNWILYEDPMRLDEFDDNLVQRFTLALFYFQTSQLGPWVSCNPWTLEGVPYANYTCDYFEYTLNSDNSVSYEVQSDPEVRWLSERHECEWLGITCFPEQSGSVIALDILGQNLTGTLPTELIYLTGLSWLSLQQNMFTGTIPEVYGKLKYLTIFEITSNLITGEMPSDLLQPNLLQLALAENFISGTIPSQIGQLSSLHSLFMFSMVLNGRLPSELGALEDVRNVWLYSNYLTGAVPSQLGNLSLLETLNLSNNLLYGSLPSELGLVPNLEQIFLSNNGAGDNDMGGTAIPEEFWNISSMAAIDFSNANFGGTISTNIGKMTNLFGLKASGNQFSGTVPSEIGLLTGLQLLWVHQNENLEGEISVDICNLRSEQLGFLNADCGGPMPRMECSCCTGCCDDFGQCQLV